MFNFSRWAIDGTRVIPQQQYTRFISNVSAFTSRRNIHLANDNSKAFIVTPNRILHELELKLSDVRDDGLRTQGYSAYGNQPYCRKSYHLSKSGRRVVGVYTSCDAGSDASLFKYSKEQSKSLKLSKTRTELKFADLSGTTDQTKTIELDYLEPHSVFGGTHGVTFSPDLSMLRAGQHLFDLTAPGQPKFWFPESPFTRLRYGADLSVAFSSCNGYLTCVEGNIDEAKDEPATFGLFRICRGARSIEKVSTFGLEDLKAEVVRAEFHTALPLLMLTCLAHWKRDAKGLAKSMSVIEIDLEALRIIQVTLPELDLNMQYL